MLTIATWLLWAAGARLVKQLHAEQIDATIEPFLEPRPGDTPAVSVRVTHKAGPADYGVLAVWDGFQNYGEYQPPWTPNLTAVTFLEPDTPGIVRLLSFEEHDDGTHGLRPIVVVGTAEGHPKSTQDGCALRVTLRRDSPRGLYAGTLHLADDPKMWRFEPDERNQSSNSAI